MVCPSQGIRTGRVSNSGGSRVALDVGIVCLQAGMHLASAAVESLGAAEGYVVSKCGTDAIDRKCREAGVILQPMIFESLGGYFF